MYFAREHFEELLDKQRRPRNGMRIGYNDVDRYFSNTMFVDLVRDGWIGSRGPASDAIKSLIRESLDSGRAVVFGVEPRDSDPAKRRPSPHHRKFADIDRAARTRPQQ